MYATLLNKRGSAPQIPGASAVFGEKGLMYGTLGGGIMEGEIQLESIQALKSHSDQVVEYNLDASIKDDKGAICGGYATVLIDVHPNEHLHEFQKILGSLRANKPGVILTSIDHNSVHRRKIKRHWVAEGSLINAELKEMYPDLDLEMLTGKALSNGQTVYEEVGDPGLSLFCQPVFPDPQLIIIGAGHIGKALSHLGRLLDFQVTVIDDRPEHANADNLPDADLILSADIEKDLAGMNITDNSYIVIVSQGHKKDTVALKQCISSSATYIGMIGSKRKTRLMKEEFLERGWASRQEWDRIYAPIGIDIQSKTVQEIAISIAAQLVQKRQEKFISEKRRAVDIIILAAGKSERMGQQKLLMPFSDTTMLEHIIKKARASNVGEVHVVLGSHYREISDSIAHLKVKVVHNKDFERGMLSSVQCGFNSLSSMSRAGMILLGDQPMVRTEVINNLVDRYLGSEKGILIPVYNGKRGHPVLIDVRYIAEINRLDPEVGLRQLMTDFKSDILEVEVKTDTILRDIDTIEDYKKELT